jgi:8-oxo-dGTP pyrophosphatase MutT (NUDIX family)
MLVGEGPNGPDILLIERSSSLRDHAGQAAFPGGATDPTDRSPVDTALREAAEEVALDPSCVSVLATAHPLYLPPSRFLVTPVFAWWHTDCAVYPVDQGETSAVARIALAELADPARRVVVRHPASDYEGPGFRAGGLFIWGFTAGLLDAVLRLGGWERPWWPTAQRVEPSLPATLPSRADGDVNPGDEALAIELLGEA